MAAAILPIMSSLGGMFGSIFGGNQASNAAQNASQQEQSATQNAMGALNPWSQMGLNSMSGLMQMIGNGTYGAGSLGAAPNAPGQFQAPTLSDVQNTPGYQFTHDEGTKGVLQGAAAAGGAISGGTLRALDQYTTGLADNTYGQAFNRNLQGYQANLADYNAQLGQYQANNQAQAQMFQQNYAPAALAGQFGYGATNSLANLMNLQGQEQAAGTLGSTQALLSGMGGAIKAGTDPSFLGAIGKMFGGGGGSVQGGNGMPSGPVSGTGWNTPGGGWG